MEDFLFFLLFLCPYSSLAGFLGSRLFSEKFTSPVLLLFSSSLPPFGFTLPLCRRRIKETILCNSSKQKIK